MVVAKKRKEREVDQAVSFSVEVKNYWRYKFAPPHYIMGTRKNLIY
jgi:hypothetical protein